MTTANKITLTRIAMIPFFIYFAAQPMLNVEEYKVGIFSFPTCTLIFWTAMWRESTIR